MRMRHGMGFLSRCGFLLLLCTGCATAPAGPYWENAEWQQELAETIHKNVTYPGVFDAVKLPTGEGTIGFDYQEGKLSDVKIVHSTGYAKLDDAIVKGVMKATPPRVGSDYRSVPHHFEMALVMQPDAAQLRLVLYDGITQLMQLPSSVIPDRPKLVYAHADYIDGKLKNVKFSRSSGTEAVDVAIAEKLKEATLPESPSNFAGKLVGLDMRFCLARVYLSCLHDVRENWMAFTGFTLVIIPTDDDGHAVR